MLLERGAKTDVLHNSSGRTLLHVVVEMGGIRAVRLLLEHGADVNVRDKDGRTPSELGSRWGQQEIVNLLSEYSAKSVK